MEAVVAQLELINSRLEKLEQNNYNRYRLNPNINNGITRGTRQGGYIVFNRNNANKSETTNNRNVESGRTATNQRRQDTARFTNYEKPRSNNPDFGRFVNNLSDSIRVKHHLKNWDNLPKDIDDLFKDIFNNIHLPLGNSNLDFKLNKLCENMKTNLIITAQDHLNLMDQELYDERQRLCKEDIEWIAKLAKGRTTRKNRRIDVHMVDDWYRQELFNSPSATAGNVSGTQNPGAYSHPEANITNDVEELTTTNFRTPKRTTSDRSPQVLPAVATNNKFQCLADIADVEEAGAHADADDNYVLATVVMPTQECPLQSATKKAKVDTKSTGTAQASKLPKMFSKQSNQTLNSTSSKPHVTRTSNERPWFSELPCTQPGSAARYEEAPVLEPTASSQPITSGSTERRKITESNKILHAEKDKTVWSIPFIKPNTEALVIADSNFREMGIGIQNWEVHVFPGAKLSHAYDILKTIPERHNLKKLIIQVGINNRALDWSINEKEFNKVFAQSQKLGLDTHYLGISIPPRIKEKEKDMLRTINAFALAKFGEKNFIQPLDPKEVSVSPYDFYLIHYDRETLNKLSRVICNHFLSETFTSRRLSL